MKTILKAAGAQDHQLSVIPKEYKTKTLALAFDWLHDIYMSDDYAKVLKVWNLLPEAVWSNYELLGVTDLTEQRLLISESKGLLKLWKTNRPRLFINRQAEICETCEEKATFTYLDDFKQCSNCNEITTNE